MGGGIRHPVPSSSVWRLQLFSRAAALCAPRGLRSGTCSIGSISIRRAIFPTGTPYLSGATHASRPPEDSPLRGAPRASRRSNTAWAACERFYESSREKPIPLRPIQRPPVWLRRFSITEPSLQINSTKPNGIWRQFSRKINWATTVVARKALYQSMTELSQDDDLPLFDRAGA